MEIRTQNPDTNTRAAWLATVLAGLPGAQEVPHGLRSMDAVSISWQGEIATASTKMPAAEFVAEALAKVSIKDPILLLNTSIATAPGTYILSEPITAERARALVERAETLSAIGHEATAMAMTTILGQPVEVNRIAAVQSPGQIAIILKVRGRVPEGVVLDLEQLEAIGYDLQILTRTA